MKIHVVGFELFLTDGRTDGRNIDRRTVMTKFIVAFRNFANAPKNCNIFFLIVAPCILVYVQFTHQQMHFYFKKH